MRKRIATILVILLLSMSMVFADNTSYDRSELVYPTTLIEKFSYVLGYAYGESYFSLFKAYYYPEVIDYFGMLGSFDASTGYLYYTEEQMNQIINDYLDDYQARLEAKAAENLKAAEDFLASNAKKKGIYTTSTGLQYQIVSQGKGAKPSKSDTVELDYELKLLNGEVIDSSYARGEHSSFPMTSVIAGFAEGVTLMPLGSHYIFYIHPDLGYGEANQGSIEPNSLLIFEVETYSIVK
ncbi:MAG: FKBP-type peptidyl-prolyl cis-trans isomerase [Sphaerochaetaceae bacterium]|nr:FKBP-type peptidyl-prolyl cis-trans isomerase [Sphaerochaetaceae bacterium]